MTAKKAVGQTASQLPPASRKERKPWVKKTPVEVVLGQIDRLRESVAQKEEALKQDKRQLQKLQEVRKILEST